MKILMPFIYLFLITIFAYIIFKRYKFITQNKNKSENKIIIKTLLLFTEIILEVAILITILLYISKLYLGSSLNLTQIEIYNIVKVSFFITAIFSYSYSNFRNKKSKIDLHIGKNAPLYFIPFFIIIEKII